MNMRTLFPLWTKLAKQRHASQSHLKLWKRACFDPKRCGDLRFENVDSVSIVRDFDDPWMRACTYRPQAYLSAVRGLYLRHIIPISIYFI